MLGAENPHLIPFNKFLWAADCDGEISKNEVIELWELFKTKQSELESKKELFGELSVQRFCQMLRECVQDGEEIRWY